MNTYALDLGNHDLIPHNVVFQCLPFPISHILDDDLGYHIAYADYLEHKVYAIEHIVWLSPEGTLSNGRILNSHILANFPQAPKVLDAKQKQ